MLLFMRLLGIFLPFHDWFSFHGRSVPFVSCVDLCKYPDACHPSKPTSASRVANRGLSLHGLVRVKPFSSNKMKKETARDPGNYQQGSGTSPKVCSFPWKCDAMWCFIWQCVHICNVRHAIWSVRMGLECHARNISANASLWFLSDTLLGLCWPTFGNMQSLGGN